MIKLVYYCVVALLLLFSSCKTRELPTEGVSIGLAQSRKANIDSVLYAIHFDIPNSLQSPITGSSSINFILKEANDAILDFRAQNDMLSNVRINGKAVEYFFSKGHIFLPRKYLSAGSNSVQLDFTAGNGSLNRNEEFLYTLLVPDRASTVFPCFDQPDMKAQFELSLSIDSSWVAVSNAPTAHEEMMNGGLKHITFSATRPISTYLFAFAAGKFESLSKRVDGLEFTLYHRESDGEKVRHNADTLFGYHARALKWLEEYTQIPYPFGKLDFVLIPGFQYGGMEHPGAIFYRDSHLLLGEQASTNQKLRQANLIAHEVAHQWFGNLVTMRWFDDVWLKEVFAGLMADKIVNPLFPNANHDLSFLLSHYPRAYSVDRTEGANPIVQKLDNLMFAGTLYGDIIYHKAPIMFQQLELLMGKKAFREGVRSYLREFEFSNADWGELIGVLNRQTPIDLASWCNRWSNTTGRPTVEVSYTLNANRNRVEIDSDVGGNGSFPPMQFDVSFIINNQEWKNTIWPDSLPQTFNFSLTDPNPTFIPNSNGIGYGCISGEPFAISNILTSQFLPNNDLTRASFLVSLHELFLEGRIGLDKYYEYLLMAFKSEKETQIQSFILNCIELVFRKFADKEFNDKYLADTERTLWQILTSNGAANEKRGALATLVSIFQTPPTISLLYETWLGSKIGSFTLTEEERTTLAIELMIRKPELFGAILQGEMERIANPDRQRRFLLISQAASPLASERVAFFDSLSKPANRKPEPWVTDGMRILNHPLRNQFAIRFIEPSLDMLVDVQRTGDIFFPKEWLDAALYGHSSAEALHIVEYWLRSNEGIDHNLKLKVLQSVDMIKRCAH